MQPNPFRQLNKAKFDHKLSQPQLKPNSTQPDITKVGFDTKMTLPHRQPPHPPPGTQRPQYLSCY